MTEGNRTLVAHGPGPGQAHEALKHCWLVRGDTPWSLGAHAAASDPITLDKVLALPVPELSSGTRDDGTTCPGVCESRVTWCVSRPQQSRRPRASTARTLAVVSTVIKCARGVSLGWHGTTGTSDADGAGTGQASL